MTHKQKRRAIEALGQVGVTTDGPPLAVASLDAPDAGQRWIVAVTRSEVIAARVFFRALGRPRLMGRPVVSPAHATAAEVSTSGNTALTQGWVFKERHDDRGLYLTIDSSTPVVIALKPGEERLARDIAAQVNARARALASAA